MKIAEIKAYDFYLMTVELKNEFKAAGCDPTCCHACGVLIKINEGFKLIPHTKEVFVKNELRDRRSSPVTKKLKKSEDEMCCEKCTGLDLDARDRRLIRNKETSDKNFVGGFSRPSKV